ncbi:MAG: response regulator transcription factor [Armatimonadota bacterium]|nr:response regulator transcription factor [Armatimonadota bacterium]MDR7451945.1 response regulator transcription factor [Armatimonadota bacterium]MDR7466627.1 response regulator transcription factor [Armatimonadota bacterium]MDR7492899.1 response regulator transcription factor [Armatimonadota bacterium]MDR7500426.1 response regulator transcription factor [Armatimonadota bacterium]
MTKIRVLLADDHELFRRGVRRLLEGAPDLEVVGEAATGRETVRLVEELAPDIVLLDIAMPELSGIDAARVIKTTSPRTGIIMLTVHADEEFLFEAIKAGAMGYLLKDASAEELFRAIRVVHGGEGLLAPTMAAKVMREFARSPDRPDLALVTTPLTAREVEILQHVAGGLANKEIAQRLAISERTVKNHLSNIMAKLHVNSRTQAAVYALRSGLVPPEG